MAEKLNLPDKEICDKYLDGMSTPKLAKEYNCSITPIFKILRNNNIKIRSISEANTIWITEKNNLNLIYLPVKKICDEYKNGMSIPDLARQYDCDVKTIKKRLCENGIRLKTFPKIPTEKICNEYKNGMSTPDLAEKYNCSVNAIRKRLNDNMIEFRSISEALTGKEVSQEKRQRISASHQGIPYDEWEDFSKKQGYCNLFNSSLKEAIRLYFGNKCFMDNEPEKNGRSPSVHHVNFDKRCGCSATQFCIFVPVKAKWNSIFNGNKEHNRWYWYSFLMNKIFIEHPNYFTYHIPVWGMNELEYNYSYVFEKFRRK